MLIAGQSTKTQAIGSAHCTAFHSVDSTLSLKTSRGSRRSPARSDSPATGCTASRFDQQEQPTAHNHVPNPKDAAVARNCPWVIVAFTCLTTAALSYVAQWVLAPHRVGFCGNLISDPLGIWLNAFLPLAWGCALAMVNRCRSSQRWPLICQFALLLLLTTSVLLMALTRSLVRDYSLPISRIWWLPPEASRLGLGR
jgi:hypothetical protein